MPFYKPVFDEFRDRQDQTGARRVAERLLTLRNQLKREVPARTVSQTLLLATWNLREFGRNQKCGSRLEESLLYIAEIISRFDLIAIQEVHQNLHDLRRLMFYLGEDWWNYIVTDVTAGRSGNQERIAFLFDSRKVRFDHLAGEVVLPAGKRSVRQLARSPFICAFRSGWRRISLCSVHIYYGTADPNDPVRVAEIGALAKLLSDRNRARQTEADGEPENVVLLGDFNVFHQTGDKTSDALEDNEFVVPKPIRKIPGGGNLARDKYYDQIAFHDPKKQLRATNKAGVFEFTQSIFRAQDAESYEKEMAAVSKKPLKNATETSKFYKQWRTFQISDHFPLWVELKTDFSDGFIATCGGIVRRRAVRREPSDLRRSTT